MPTDVSMEDIYDTWPKKTKHTRCEDPPCRHAENQWQEMIYCPKCNKVFKSSIYVRDNLEHALAVQKMRDLSYE